VFVHHVRQFCLIQPSANSVITLSIPPDIFGSNFYFKYTASFMFVTPLSLRCHSTVTPPSLRCHSAVTPLSPASGLLTSLHLRYLLVSDTNNSLRGVSINLSINHEQSSPQSQHPKFCTFNSLLPTASFAYSFDSHYLDNGTERKLLHKRHLLYNQSTETH
jgi:hypothetical protein